MFDRMLNQPGAAAVTAPRGGGGWEGRGGEGRGFRSMYSLHLFIRLFIQFCCMCVCGIDQRDLPPAARMCFLN